MKRLVGAAAAVLILSLSVRFYAGFHNYYAYQELRREAVSIEGSFSRLEARLRRAVRFYGNPVFFKELARLYLERALAENEFGTPKSRDEFLDRAQHSLSEQIVRSPADAFAYYELGKTWMLYNFPLMTYFDRGKACFDEALRLYPTHEFLNLSIILTYLTQWQMLTERDRSVVRLRVRMMEKANKDFMPKLRDRWLRSYENTEKLDDILTH